eukprot:73171-Alexandrium_andersonii.AAC.1
MDWATITKAKQRIAGKTTTSRKKPASSADVASPPPSSATAHERRFYHSKMYHKAMNQAKKEGLDHEQCKQVARGAARKALDLKYK